MSALRHQAESQALEIGKQDTWVGAHLATLIDPTFEESKHSAATSKLVWTLLRAGGLSVSLIDPTVKDPISRLIVEALMARGPLTVSSIAQYVRQSKGSSSRTTIRARIACLVESRVLTKAEKDRGWALSESFLRQIWGFCARWSTAAEGPNLNAPARSDSRVASR
jgi:hypothetical protein